MPQEHSSLPLLHTVASLVVAAALIIAALLTGGTAQAHPTTPTALASSAAYTGAALAPSAWADPALVALEDLAPDGEDLHASACQLSWAFHSGAPVFEDLSFAGATDLYRALRPYLVDQFKAAHPGLDSDERGELLEDWLDDVITAPCSDLDSGA